MKKEQVEAECSACGGTGLYCGICERKGTAVICVRCDGTGKEVISYTPFTGRKGRRGIHTVSWSRGSSILCCGAGGHSISYNDFVDGKFPPTK